MGGKGVEPLRTFVHTVLSRARLPFRHPPITSYILEYLRPVWQGTASTSGGVIFRRRVTKLILLLTDRLHYVQCSRRRLFLSDEHE